jgi:hypothetical protein
MKIRARQISCSKFKLFMKKFTALHNNSAFDECTMVNEFYSVIDGSHDTLLSVYVTKETNPETFRMLVETFIEALRRAKIVTEPQMFHTGPNLS